MKHYRAWVDIAVNDGQDWAEAFERALDSIEGAIESASADKRQGWLDVRSIIEQIARQKAPHVLSPRFEPLPVLRTLVQTIRYLKLGGGGFTGDAKFIVEDAYRHALYTVGEEP